MSGRNASLVAYIATCYLAGGGHTYFKVGTYPELGVKLQVPLWQVPAAPVEVVQEPPSFALTVQPAAGSLHALQGGQVAGHCTPGRVQADAIQQGCETRAAKLSSRWQSLGQPSLWLSVTACHQHPLPWGFEMYRMDLESIRDSLGQPQYKCRLYRCPQCHWRSCSRRPH